MLKLVLTVLSIIVVAVLSRDLLQTLCICDLTVYAAQNCHLPITHYDTPQFAEGCLPIFNESLQLIYNTK